MQENERPAKLTIILGTNGTGKTTILKNILQSTNSAKNLIVTPDDIEWQECDTTELALPSDFVYRGTRRHIFNPDKTAGTLAMLEYFKCGIIVFDDCRGYLTSATDQNVRNLIIRRRQRSVDVFAVGHGFTEVPPVFFTFATDIILFRTTDQIARRKNCLKNYEQMMEAQLRVNQKAAKNPHYFEHIKFV